MFFRFANAVALVVAISVAGVGLEKRNLQLRRELTRQHYRTDLLHEQLARLRLRTQELGAPVRLIDALESGRLELKRPEKSLPPETPRMPLLRWQRFEPDL